MEDTMVDYSNGGYHGGLQQWRTPCSNEGHHAAMEDTMVDYSNEGHHGGLQQ